MGKYARIALKSGGSFGVCMGVFYALQAKSAFVGLVGGVISGVLFGAGMAVFSGWADRRSKAAGRAIGDDAVVQKRTVIVIASQAEALRLARDALMELKAGERAYDPASGTIEADVPWSWKSFGEKLTISINRVSDLESAIEVVSRPRLSTTAVDYGKNFQNVEAICNRIAHRAG